TDSPLYDYTVTVRTALDREHRKGYTSLLLNVYSSGHTDHIKDNLGTSNSKVATSSQGLTVKRVNLYYTATDLNSAYYF
ncbi:21570_t:CDS:2, partial [Cetraspora pellucida]